MILLTDVMQIANDAPYDDEDPRPTVESSDAFHETNALPSVSYKVLLIDRVFGLTYASMPPKAPAKLAAEKNRAIR